MAAVCGICSKPFPTFSTKYPTKDKKVICKSCAKELGLSAFSSQKYTLSELIANGVQDEVDPHAKKIEDRLNELGLTDVFGTKKEIKALHKYINDDEQIQYVASGLTEENSILLVLTDERMIFLDKGIAYGVRKTEIPIDKINSVSYDKGMLMSKLKVFNGAALIEIRGIPNTSIEPLTAAINTEIKRAKTPNTVMVNNSKPSVTDEIRNYKSLLDDRIITQEEFDAKKKELLGL